MQKGNKLSGDKAPVLTYCRQFSLAIEQLALRSKKGHQKYIDTDADWQNFSRIENPNFEYGNAMLRHAMGIGDDEDELGHYAAAAWNAVADLEMYLRKNNDKVH